MTAYHYLAVFMVGFLCGMMSAVGLGPPQQPISASAAALWALAVAMFATVAIITRKGSS